MAQPRVFQRGERIQARRLNEIIAGTIQRVSGPVSYHGGGQVSVVAPRMVTHEVMRLVKIVAATSYAGLYEGVLLWPGTAPLPEENLSMPPKCALLPDDPAEMVTVINLREAGAEVNLGLLAYDSYHCGMRVGYDGDGREVIAVDVQTATLFAVDVEKDGGDAGDADTPCTFTYTVRTLTGVQLGENLSPRWARPAVGPMLEATHGMAFFDDNGLLVLDHVDEVPDSEVCSTESSS